MIDQGVMKFVAHGRYVQRIAQSHGWRPGARYTNLRDIRDTAFQGAGFLDIDWKKYCFTRHIEAAARARPLMTVARDVVDIRKLDVTLREAEALSKHAAHVIIVPKDRRMARQLDSLIPDGYMLGFSVPTRYGGTTIDPKHFLRPVHLLGGRPDAQRRLAEQMPVVSVDCNRFTLDAGFGDYFDGDKFRPHPVGGYENCLTDSIKNIDDIWSSYRPKFQMSSRMDGERYEGK